MIRVLFLLLSLCLFSCEDMLKAGKEADIELESLPSHLLPPRLSWNYYPGGVTHAQLLDRLPDAVRKTGFIGSDETWSGVIHVTGDLQVNPGVSLTIEEGTLVLIAARTDDQQSGPSDDGIDQYNPKDPPFIGHERTSIIVQGGLYVNGTKENPVIFTSDAENPQNDDWGGIDFQEPSSVRITRAIIEFGRYIGGGYASDVVIAKSVLRNMMGCVVLGSIGPETTLEGIMNLTPEDMP